MEPTLEQVFLTFFWSITPKQSFFLLRSTCMSLRYMDLKYMEREDPSISNLLLEQLNTLKTRSLELKKKSFIIKWKKQTKKIQN